MQYLTGEQAFWRHVFRVTPDVLIPRPETELLVEMALQCIEPHSSATIADVGTGSGCIALSIASERELARVTAIDISPAALRLAMDNARALDIANVDFLLGDLLQPLINAHEKVDLIVSNPPYVPRDVLASLAPEVRAHEPVLALCAPDDDPLRIYKRLAEQATVALSPMGSLAVEVGIDMAGDVAALFESLAWRIVEVRNDLQGIPRAILARPRPAGDSRSRAGSD
ncbi:MAG: peptide chain release factor N(5)-glutamine methyltransferase [Vicinamibacteria bacterium]|nr:peptide chain release factor N(5)-glutamine methyltransferase [Vicinamibacteria bacterium]